MKQVEKSVVIAAPPDQVWDYMTDYQRYPEWMDGFQGFRPAPRERRAAQGTTSRQLWRYSGLPRTFDVEVIEAEENRLHSVRATSGEWYGTWLLEPADGGTRVTWRFAYRMPFGPIGIIADKLALGKQIAGSLERSLENVKRRIEQGGVQPSRAAPTAPAVSAT